MNQSSYEWAVENLPLFESSDDDLNQAYYYRAKSYKSHMMRTDCECHPQAACLPLRGVIAALMNGRCCRAPGVDIKHVSSEFGPSVPWGGPYGTINAAAGRQITASAHAKSPPQLDFQGRF